MQSKSVFFCILFPVYEADPLGVDLYSTLYYSISIGKNVTNSDTKNYLFLKNNRMCVLYIFDAFVDLYCNLCYFL